MKTKRLIESLRTTAHDLVISNGGVFHAEGGFRGQIARFYSMENGSPLAPDTTEAFWTRLLCVHGRPEDVIYSPYQTDGFSFEAAIHPGAVTTEHEQLLDGIGLSIFYGAPEQMHILSRLIASPLTKHVHKYIGKDCGRPDSYYDTTTSLAEWIYMMYELGLKMEIPALRRCYRLITPIATDDKNNFLCGFSDTNPIYANAWTDETQWSLIWTAAQNNEIAYSKLGTDLFVASQIALDYLIEYDFAAFANEFNNKTPHKYKRAERATAIDRIKQELREHLRGAKDHAIATRDRGHAKLLKRPSQKDIAKRLSLSETTVSRCMSDRRDKEIQNLWKGANNLESVLGYRS